MSDIETKVGVTAYAIGLSIAAFELAVWFVAGYGVGLAVQHFAGARFPVGPLSLPVALGGVASVVCLVIAAVRKLMAEAD